MSGDISEEGLRQIKADGIVPPVNTCNNCGEQITFPHTCKGIVQPKMYITPCEKCAAKDRELAALKKRATISLYCRRSDLPCISVSLDCDCAACQLYQDCQEIRP